MKNIFFVILALGMSQFSNAGEKSSVSINCEILKALPGLKTQTLLSSSFEVEPGTTTTILETQSAIYQADVVAGRKFILINVLDKANKRIASAKGDMVLGTSVAEPNFETQIDCHLN